MKYFMDINKEDIVLDAGCGDGFISTVIAKKAKKVVAIDIDANIIEWNKKTIKLNNLDFICVDITGELDFRRVPHFTKIICLDVLEHVKQSADTIRNFALLLKPGGEVFITVPTGGGHGSDVKAEVIEGHLKENMLQIIELKMIKAPPITANFKKYLELLQSFFGYKAREVECFSQTISFELERKNPLHLILYKLFFLIIIKPFTLLERRPFREPGRHLVVIAKKSNSEPQ